MPSSRKGGAFEREFAKELSLWWSDGQHDDWFWRSSASGGRATQRAKAGKTTINSVGDISAQSAEAHQLLKLVTFELKRGYNAHTIEDLLDKPKCLLQDFLDQATRQASLSGTPYWALVRKRDRRKALVFTNIPQPQDRSKMIGFNAIPWVYDAWSTGYALPLEDFLCYENRQFLKALV